MLRFTLLLLVSALPFNLFAQTSSKESMATIAGVVTLNGEPMRGVTVTLQLQIPSAPSRAVPPRAKTDANGRFRITGVSAGQYTVGALAPALVTESNQISGQNFGLQGKTVNVADGETVENLDLVLKRGGVITGRITDARDEPVVETNVRLSRVSERNASGVQGPPPPPMNMSAYRTDDRGVYRIFGLPAGKYKVSVGLSVRQGVFSMQTSRSYLPETFHPDTTDEAQAKIIEVEEGQEVTDIDIKAAEEKKAFEISGRVVDAETGQPVIGIGVAFGSFDQTGRVTGSMSSGWRTDVNGEFQILGARPGKHGVFIENREGKSELYSDPTPVEVLDSDVAGVEIRALRGASISGAVVIEGTSDPAILARRSQITINTSPVMVRNSPRQSGQPNQPNPNATLSSRRSVMINRDGSFRFGGLPPGKVSITSYSVVPKLSLLRVEQNGVRLKDSILEMHSGEQINNVRVIFGYSDGTVRGQVKIIGGTLPEGIGLAVGLWSTNGASNDRPMTPLDARGQFTLRDLFPGEYELRLSALFPGGRPPREFIEKILPRLTSARQIISVSNGNEVQTTFTVDLSQENQR